MGWLTQALSALQELDWRALVPPALGAILGGAIASLNSLLVARRTSRETLRRDQTARFETRKAATLRAMVKLLTIVNGIETLHRGLEGMIASADAQGHQEMALWQKVMPFVGITEAEIRFDADEVAVFVAKEAAYLNDLLLLVERYTTLKAAFTAYGLQRAKLTDQLSAVMTGSVGTTYLSPEQQQRFAPRAHELDVLVTQLRETAALDWDMALRVAKQFGPKVRAQLSDPTFPLLTLDSARAQAVRPLGPPPAISGSPKA